MLVSRRETESTLYKCILLTMYPPVAIDLITIMWTILHLNLPSKQFKTVDYIFYLLLIAGSVSRQAMESGELWGQGSGMDFEWRTEDCGNLLA